jgi:hypothetical protein
MHREREEAGLERHVRRGQDVLGHGARKLAPDETARTIRIAAYE